MHPSVLGGVTFHGVVVRICGASHAKGAADTCRSISPWKENVISTFVGVKFDPGATLMLQKHKRLGCASYPMVHNARMTFPPSRRSRPTISLV